MAGTFSVFNIGTSHTQRENDNTIVKLWQGCVATKLKEINDGVGTGEGLDKYLGGFFGAGLDKRCADTVAKIMATQANRVNIAGHSRGGALCHMIANDLTAKKFAGEINMIVLDPVNQSSHTDRAKILRKAMKLGEYVAIVMENISGRMDTLSFPLTEVKPEDKKFRDQMRVINMPGKHGSGTQIRTAVGEAVYRTMNYYMNKWKTTFIDTYAPAAIAESYAGIHLENPVLSYKSGEVNERRLLDGDKVDSRGVDFRKGQIGSMLKTGGIDGGKAPDLRNTGYFFNEFHARMFQQAFPACWERMVGEKDYWQNKANNALHKFELKKELTTIGLHYPRIQESLKKCQLL